MSALGWLFDSAPLWLIGPMLLLLLLLCFRPASGCDQKARRVTTALTTKAISSRRRSLCSGCSSPSPFRLALNRYDGRRVLVVEEANAIGTAWLRAGLAEGESGRSLQQAIARYTDIRLRLPHSANDAEINRIEHATARAQSDLWRRMKAALPTMQPPIGPTLVTAMNDVFDVAASRKAERAANVPTEVLARAGPVRRDVRDHHRLCAGQHGQVASRRDGDIIHAADARAGDDPGSGQALERTDHHTTAADDRCSCRDVASRTFANRRDPGSKTRP